MSFFPQFRKKILLTVRFGCWHIDSYKICILFKYSRVALLEYIHSLEALFVFICKNVTYMYLCKIKSHWWYILGRWHLNKWVKRWFKLELHCQPPFRKFVHIVCIACHNIYFVQLRGWYTISIKSILDYTKLVFEGYLSCMANAKSFLADWIQNRIIKVYNRGRYWDIALNEINRSLYYIQ